MALKPTVSTFASASLSINGFFDLSNFTNSFNHRDGDRGQKVNWWERQNQTVSSLGGGAELLEFGLNWKFQLLCPMLVVFLCWKIRKSFNPRNLRALKSI